jgi:arylsulfatase A-like enzyme
MQQLKSVMLISGIIPMVSIGFFSCQTDKEKLQYDLPNVIFILVDDLGYGDLSCYGQQTLSTPHIDQMAEEGILFTQFYAGSSVCAPSRTSLLTGKHQGFASVRANRPDQLVPDEEYTIGKLFKDAGYETGAIGKWGIGHPPPPDDPQKKGFDYFYGYINMYHAHNFFPEFLYENGRKVMLNNKLATVNDKNPWADKAEGTGVSEIRNEYAHDLFDAKAIEFIEKNKANKFFLYLPYNDPHSNTEGLAYSGDGMEVPDYYEFADKDWPNPEKGFAAMIRNIDNSVGLIIEKLKELGLDEETLIIFTSDNGPHESGGHIMEFFDSNGELRGKKADLYEGGIRVPFIARWPGVIKKGIRSDELFAFWDFLPTFSDLVNGKKIEDVNGISFKPTLLGQKQKERHEYLYWEFYNWNYQKDRGMQAIRKGEWKALKLHINAPGKDEVFELYNLETDPGETTNLVGQHPEIDKMFKELFISSREEFDILPLY